MSEMVEQLGPFRWKVFQVLVVKGQNDGDQRKRDATKFIVTDEQYQEFCRKHEHLKCMIPEPNSAMKSSYLVSRSAQIIAEKKVCDGALTGKIAH
jgi:radical S-adenosyl methionine domain-containing protein 2